MKLFKVVAVVEGMADPMVDYYEGETLEQAEEVWLEDAHRYGIPMERTKVRITEEGGS